jgi:hypothetical protein
MGNSVRAALGLALIALVLLALPVMATGFGLQWWTVDGGGNQSNGDSYALSGIIGQPDAGELSGGCYSLSGGFWAGGNGSSSGGDKTYLPIVVK